MARPDHILITCEHGGNRVPPRYASLFAGFETLLRSHRGYDPGALTLARQMAWALAAPLFVSTTSRLLIDLNRSIGHPRLYAEATRNAPASVRREILEQHYLPYRNRVEAHIADANAHGNRVIHLSSHSFTPVLAAFFPGCMSASNSKSIRSTSCAAGAHGAPCAARWFNLYVGQSQRDLAYA